MLLIIPPSEAKRPAPDHGLPVDLGTLSFPALRPMRERILDALIATSARQDAASRLLVGQSLAWEVERNTHLRALPAQPVLEVYTGVVHGGLDAATLSPAAAARASQRLIIASALWGALRPADRIPPYRLHVCSRLVRMDRLEPTWRTVLPDVLAMAADGHGLVLDVRSPGLQAIGRPTGLEAQTVHLRIDRADGDGRRADTVTAKRTRGEAVRVVLESGEDPADADALASVLADRWPVALERPVHDGGSWTIALRAGS